MIKALQKKDHGKATFIKSQLLYFSMEQNNVLCVFALPLIVVLKYFVKSRKRYKAFTHTLTCYTNKNIQTLAQNAESGGSVKGIISQQKKTRIYMNVNQNVISLRFLHSSQYKLFF